AIDEARCTYSLVCSWILSHGSGSASSSLPIIGVKDCGPLVSLPMIARISPDDLLPSPPPKPPRPPPPDVAGLPVLVSVAFLHAPVLNRATSNACNTIIRPTHRVITIPSTDENNDSPGTMNVMDPQRGTRR